MIRTPIYCFLFLMSIPIVGQSLIRNGDMESHTEFEDGFSNLIANPGFEFNKELTKNKGQSVSSEFANVSGWNILGWQSFYCHCNRNPENNWFLPACRKNLYSPRTGCGMIKMVFEENCNSDPELNSEVRLQGCTSYLKSKLSTPLEVGAVYEMSFWIYFPKDSIVESSIAYNIGFLPSLHSITMSPNNMLNINKFFHDTIPQGQWFQVKKYIRALCPLEYVIIGTFRNKSFPTLKRPTFDHYAFYFIDDVLVEKVNEDSLDTKIIPTPYCAFYEDEDQRLEVGLNKKITIHFNSNQYSFSSGEQIRLDSFINAIEEKWKPVYSIVGHADSTGNENEALSLKRADTIQSYLQLKHTIPDFRMVTFGASSSSPLEKNNSIEGRAINRRATITVTSLSKAMGLYRHCLELCSKNETDEAISVLKKWVSSANYYEVIYTLFDYRLESIRNTAYWKSIRQELLKKYNANYTSKDAFFLDSLRCEDQKYRTLELPILGLSGYFKEYESFDFIRYTIPDDSLAHFDSNNLHALSVYLAKNDFPKIFEIGRRNVEGLIYIMIHGGDTTMMSTYLPIIEKRCLEGEAEWISWAMMHDKLCQLQNVPQHYGMQSVFIDPEKTQLQLYTLDNLDAVNARRRSIGMSMITDPMEIMHVRHH